MRRQFPPCFVGLSFEFSLTVWLDLGKGGKRERRVWVTERCGKREETERRVFFILLPHFAHPVCVSTLVVHSRSDDSKSWKRILSKA